MENEEQIKYPNLGHSFLILAMFFVIAIVISFSVSFYSNKSTILISTILCNLLLIFILYRIKTAFGDKPFLHYKRKLPSALFILLIPSMLLLSFFTDEITNLLPEMSEEYKDIMQKSINTSWSSIISVVVVAPICEEIIIRGIICDGLLRNFKNPHFAIFWSSIIFGVMHLNIWQGLSAFILGYFLGWIYYKTRSVVPCIFMHCVNNSFSMLILILMEKKGINTTLSMSDVFGYNDLIFSIVSFALFVLCLLLLKRFLPKENFFK